MFIFNRQPQNFSDFKAYALMLGTEKQLYSRFAECVKLKQQYFPVDKSLEIAMSWMLGFFRAHTGLYLSYRTSEHSYHGNGISFFLKTSDTNLQYVGIKMLYNAKLLKIQKCSDDVKAVPLYPPKCNLSISGKTMNGIEALYNIISNVYYPDIIERTLKEDSSFAVCVNWAWEYSCYDSNNMPRGIISNNNTTNNR